MKKVLLAIDSDVVGQELMKNLSGLCDPVWCEDGDQALEYLMNTVPDILVLDMSLCGADSVTVGTVARQINDKCQIIGISGLVEPYVIHILEQIGACHLMRFPCDIGALTGRIVDLLMEGDSAQDHRRQIAAILASLGCCLSRDSSQITQLAICVFLENPNQFVTGELYPKVAALRNGTKEQVEKAIRYCISSTMQRCNGRLWKLYFGTDKNGRLRKPSNKEFLFRISSCVREKDQASEITVEGCNEKIV